MSDIPGAGTQCRCRCAPCPSSGRPTTGCARCSASCVPRQPRPTATVTARPPTRSARPPWHSPAATAPSPGSPCRRRTDLRGRPASAAFSLTVGGHPLALAALRPRARSTLRLLALHAGQPVHREVLLASLWPEADEASASRSLLTTLSSLRTALREGGAEGALQREGAAYLLSAQTVLTDLTLADRALARARRYRDTAPEDADAAYVHALDLYAGEVLAEEGPAEWVSRPREQWSARMSTAAHELAVLRYRRGQLTGAVAAARRGLTLDRWSDPLWRVLIAALRAGDDSVSADRAEGEYTALLVDLAG